MPTTPAKPAKTMSSRLLTMKFMQRAAASSSPAPVEDPEIPSPKRQRLSTTSDPTTPKPASDLEAVNAALAAEEQRRADAIARQAAEAGETNWVLDFEGPVPAVKTTASSRPIIIAADSLDVEDQELSDGGRKTYGGFKSRSRRIEFETDAEELPQDPKALAEYHAARERERKRKERRADREMQNATSISGGGGARSATVNDQDRSKKHGGKPSKKRSK